MNDDGIIVAGPKTQERSGSHMQHNYSYTTVPVVNNNDETMHVTDASYESVESLCSALCEVCLENEKLQSVLEAKCNELESICVEREIKLESEIAELQVTLSAISLEEVE